MIIKHVNEWKRRQVVRDILYPLDAEEIMDKVVALIGKGANRAADLDDILDRGLCEDLILQS